MKTFSFIFSSLAPFCDKLLEAMETKYQLQTVQKDPFHKLGFFF